MNECCTSIKENLSVLNKGKSILKWNLNIFLRSRSLSFESIESKGNLLSKLFPDIVLFTKLFIIHVTFLSQYLENMLWLEWSKSMVEESCLLCSKPSSKIIVSAICKSTDKMTNVVIFSGVIKLFHTDSTKYFFIWIEDTLYVEFVLSWILINFCRHYLIIVFFVGSIQKLNLLQNLKSGNCDVLEFVDSDNILRSFIVEANVSWMDMGISNVLSSTLVLH